MTNRRIFSTVVAAAFVALLLPVLTASAQSNEPWWSRGRNRDNDRYGRGYDYRGLRDAIRRVEDRSDDFENRLDSALDRSRYDDTYREDRINQAGRDFRTAASRLRNRFNERDLNRSQSEARELLQVAARIDRFLSRNRLDGRVESEWSRMRSDLRLIADAYNIRFNNGGYGRDRNNGRRWPY
ncbi:MAG TPA: hypothetical protein VF666_09660 [Pyrinomonadaceae bacterium]